MNPVFADTQFWVALINPHDQWHERALEVESNLVDPFYVTTDSVLTEILTFFCEYGTEARLKASATVELILGESTAEVIPTTREVFLNGLALYKARPDKSYSLTDCISMNICREREITDVLTHDHHFTQEGLTVLM